MTKFITILFLLPVFLFAQKEADKEYYLVDSLVLENLTKSDRILLDSCLAVFSFAKDDTSKIKSLTVLCDNLVNDVWSDYQFFQFDLIQRVLKKKSISTNEIKVIELIKGGALNNLGLYYEFQEGNSSIALDYYLKALALFEKIGDKKGEAMMLNRIGAVYTEQDNAKKGFEYYQKSLKIYNSINEQKEISNPLNNLGLYYQQIGDYPSSISYFEESLEIDEATGNQQGVAISYSNLGKSYMSKKEYDKSLIYFIQGLNIFKQMEDQNGIALVSTNIGHVYYKQEDYKSAYVNAKRSFDIAQKENLLVRISPSALLLSEIYEKQNKKEEALKMYKLYINVRDSMTNVNTRSSAVKQQAKYEYDKQKAVDNATYGKQIAIEKEAQEKQKVISYAIGIGLSLVVVFLLFVFNRLQVTRKQKVIIESAHSELSEKNKEILDSITYAKRIQRAILPTSSLVNEYLKDSFILFKPKDIVAGDFYWLEKKENNVIFAAADCTGHGVPGAMVSVVCNNALNRSVREYGLTDPGEILDKTREIVIEEFNVEGEVGRGYDYVKDGMDIALCSLEGTTLKYAGANNPLLIVRKGEVIITTANKQPIGRYRSFEPFTTHTFKLQKEDAIYIFSDGYADQFGGKKGKKFMIKKFRDLLLSINDKPMAEQKKLLNTTFKNWKDELEQVDDVCVIGVRI